MGYNSAHMARRDDLPSDMLKGVHVLVVDDNRDARELYRTIFSYAGALVTIVASAHDALKTMAEIRPDVLVADLTMPRRDGYWLIAQVRALPQEHGGRVPAIAVTGQDRHTHTPTRSREAGFQAHLYKPVDHWELCRTAVALAGRRA